MGLTEATQSPELGGRGRSLHLLSYLGGGRWLQKALTTSPFMVGLSLWDHGSAPGLIALPGCPWALAASHTSMLFLSFLP